MAMRKFFLKILFRRSHQAEGTAGDLNWGRVDRLHCGRRTHIALPPTPARPRGEGWVLDARQGGKRSPVQPAPLKLVQQVLPSCRRNPHVLLFVRFEDNSICCLHIRHSIMLRHLCVLSRGTSPDTPRPADSKRRQRIGNLAIGHRRNKNR